MIVLAKVYVNEIQYYLLIFIIVHSREGVEVCNSKIVKPMEILPVIICSSNYHVSVHLKLPSLEIIIKSPLTHTCCSYKVRIHAFPWTGNLVKEKNLKLVMH